MAASTNVQVIISAVDKASATVRKVQKAIDGLHGGDGKGGHGPSIAPNGKGGHGPEGKGGGGSHLPPLAPNAPGGRGDGHGPEDRPPRRPGGSHEHEPSGRHGPGGRSSEAGFAPFGFTPGMIGAVTGGLSAKEIITQSADFQTMLTNIQKKAGATTEQTRKLGEEIKEIATSGKVAAPIEEIASAYERGAAAGLPLDQLKEFATLSAKAADAFEMTAAEVGNASAGFNTVFKIPINEMERYFDLINSLADAGIADESGIVRYIDQGGAMAKTFGLTANQVAAVGATLENLKVSASKGATATNSIFAKLLAPNALSNDAREAYYKLIKDDKKFQKQLANGKADEAFISILDSLKGMNNEARTGLVVDLFGQDHMDVVLQMVEGVDELKRNLKMAAGTDWVGSLGRSYELKLKDFWSQWQIFKNQVSRTVIDVGTGSLSHLTEGLNAARALFSDIGAGIKQLKLDIDWQDVDRAGRAVSDLKTTVSNFLGMEAGDSAIMTFFKDLAGVVNDVTQAIITLENKLVQIKESPAGQMIFGDAEAKKEGADRLGANWDEKNNRMGAAPLKPGPIPGLNEWINKRNGLDTPDAGSAVDRDRQGRVRTFNEDRFGAPPASATETQQKALDSYIKSRGTGLAPNADLGKTTGAIPIPTPRPDMGQLRADVGEALSLIQNVDAAKNGLATPVVATADINIAPAMAKIATLKTAMNDLNNTRLTPGTGGANVGSNVRNQFAPVGAG